jgi:multidrug efflux pump subunit AcrB
VKRVIFWAIHNPLVINVGTVLLLFFGAVTLLGLQREMFPSVVLDQVQVRVAFPGASAEEVEEGVLLKLEEAIEGIPDFDEVRASARDNLATMTIVLKKGADLNERVQDVKNAVDGIIGLPADAEKPIVSSVRRTSQVISMLLVGDMDREILRQQAERLKEELIDLPEVSLVSITGVPNREIAIEPSEAAMRRYGLSFDEITVKVRAYSLNLSGGSLKTEDEELRLRVYGRRYEASEYAAIPVRALTDGTVIRLGDIADVREDWEDSPQASWYEGLPSITIRVEKTDREDSITIVEAVKAWMAEAEIRLPEGLRIEVLRDSTISLRQRIDLLVNNGLLGLGLVLLTLTLFLNLRLSFWVALGIPISYAGMFFLLGYTPATINMISLFGMILVLGIVVDDAIVVGENIYQHVERGADPIRAAIRGTLEVTPAVTAAVLTTIVAFIPFFFLEGRMGLFIWQMGLVVILCLVVSLVECLLILPPHLAHSAALHGAESAKDSRSGLRRWLDGRIEALRNGFYSRTLRRLLGLHWVTVSLGASALLLAAGLIAGGTLPFIFFPRIDRDDVDITVKMAAGTREARTHEVLRLIEDTARGLEPWLQESQPDGRPVLEAIRLNLGPASEQGDLTLKLLDSESRALPSAAVARRLRQMLPPIPDAEEINVGAMGGRNFGSPVEIRVLGTDIEVIELATDQLLDELRALPALTDISDSREIGKRELRLRMKPEGEALGLSLREASRQVRQAFYGEEILRFQRGHDEIKVWTRLAEPDRASIEQLLQTRLRTPAGDLVPFGAVLDIEMDRGLVEIQHIDRKREITVSADIDEESARPDEVLFTVRNEVLPRLQASFPTARFSWGGQQEQQAQTTASMRLAFPIALLVIAFILVVVFRSVTQMAMVLSMIPLGLVGAILGHLLLGKPLTILSIYGMIGLSGIVINDSVVFIDRINRELKDGLSLRDAVHAAGLKRFRPILLTTITTVAGMMPIILETSRQAQFLIPMAISIGFGLLFGTMFTVYILPSLFLVFNDLRRLAAMLRNRLAGRFVSGRPAERQAEGNWWPVPESVEPALRRPVVAYREELC